MVFLFLETKSELKTKSQGCHRSENGQGKKFFEVSEKSGKIEII